MQRLYRVCVWKSTGIDIFEQLIRSRTRLLDQPLMSLIVIISAPRAAICCALFKKYFVGENRFRKFLPSARP